MKVDGERFSNEIVGCGIRGEDVETFCKDVFEFKNSRIVCDQATGVRIMGRSGGNSGMGLQGTQEICFFKKNGGNLGYERIQLHGDSHICALLVTIVICEDC